MAGTFDEHDGRPTAGALADALVDFAAERVERLARHHAPGLVLPRVFAGHAVGPDTRSDLAYTLGLLYEAGRKEIAGVPLDEAVLATLRSLDGARTDTFYSYRAAESLARIGGWRDNPRLAGLSDAERANLREAFDSSASADGVRAGRLPRNYAVVVARCEHARDALGLLPDTALLEELCARSRALIGRATDGWIDDSNDDRGQYDIYTADVFLFAEPLAARLGDVFTDGLRRVLADVDALALPGGAVVWGRSIGALGLALTIELAAIGAARGLAEDPPVWLARAAWSLTELRRWFSDRGVIRAHQHRQTMFYRGPARRLQMTLDVLGKLVLAALDLRRAPALRAAKPHDAWRPVDRWVRMGPADPSSRNAHAGAWAHRGAKLSFVLPLVGGFSSDYLPAPRAPGLFEVPTSGPISMVPVVHRRGKQLVAAGPPVRVEHRAGALEVEYRGFSEIAAGPGQPPALDGSRIARFRVDGRTLVVEESLAVDADPASLAAIALQVPVVAGRPLDVVLDADAPHRVDEIDVAGLAEWRSFWSEIGSVHQLDVEPRREVALRWRVTPRLRVASTAHEHAYDESLYGPIRDRVVARAAPNRIVDRPDALREVDVLHVHWPEWWQGPDLERNRRALERLRDAGTRVVWTQHNLAPHAFRGDEGRALYAMWAAAADAVIHHTAWGRDQALSRYRYRDDAIHRVIPHGHWGSRYAPHAAVDRATVEAELSLPPCALRLGVVGAPRVEKDVQLVLDAFHACSRDDLQLFVVCIAGETVPDDPRIVALPAAHVPEHVYFRRLVAMDALVFPFREGMLMTGTAFDAIGAGKAAIVSDWPLLAEVLGPGAIRYGSTRDDLRMCLERLTAVQIRDSARAIEALQPRTEWADIAGDTLSLLEEVALA